MQRVIKFKIDQARGEEKTQAKKIEIKNTFKMSRLSINNEAEYLLAYT